MSDRYRFPASPCLGHHSFYNLFRQQQDLPQNTQIRRRTADKQHKNTPPPSVSSQHTKSIIQQLTLSTPSNIEGEKHGIKPAPKAQQKPFKRPRWLIYSECLAWFMLTLLALGFILIPLAYRKWPLPEFRFGLTDGHGTMRPLLSVVWNFLLILFT